MNKIRLSCALLASVFAIGHGPAEADNTYAYLPPHFDLNQDGVVDPEESLAYFRHQHVPGFAAIDTNFDGVIGKDERAAVLAALETADRISGPNQVPTSQLSSSEKRIKRSIQSAEIDFQAYVDAGRTPRFAAAPAPPVGPLVLEDGTEIVDGVIVRGAYYQPTVFGNTPAMADPTTELPELATASAAQVQYSKDNVQDSEQLSVSGAVTAFRHWTFNPEENEGSLQRAAIAAGVEVDRSFALSGGGSDRDVLTFRADGVAAYQGLWAFDADFFAVGAKFTTNFDLETAVASGSASWAPYDNDYGIGNIHTRLLPGPFSVLINPTLKAEYYQVVENGGLAHLSNQDDFLFVGPTLNAKIFFEFDPFRDAYIDLSGRAMSDALDFSSGTNYFRVSANLPLDQEQHFVLSLTYQNGENPNTLQQVEDITLGLGIKF